MTGVKAVAIIVASILIVGLVDLHPAVMTFVYGFALFLFLMGMFFLIKSLKDYKYVFLNKPKLLNEDISLYEVADEGILVNHFNDKQYIITIPWETINYVSIEPMEYRRAYTDNGQRDYSKMESRLRKEVRKVKNTFPDFIDTELTAVLDDKRMITCHSSNNQVNQLPIPPSWELNGQAVKFLEAINLHFSGKVLEHQDKLDLLDEYLPPVVSSFIKKRVDK